MARPKSRWFAGPPVCVVVAVLALGACGGDDGGDQDAGDQGEVAGEAEAPDRGDGDRDRTDREDVPGEADVADHGDGRREDGEAGGCGDGIVDPGEECDDGARNSDTRADACRTNCVAAHCGDRVVDSDEGCDDGNDAAGDGCSPECRPEGCGNGIVDPGEECDDGNADDGDDCPTTCRPARCGDGFLRRGHEACDGAEPLACFTSCSTTGTRSCVDCAWETGCTPPDESCDGLDDDCDTAVDEDFPCARGRTTPCTTSCASTGSGLCTAVCEPPGSEACGPPPESCNALDDDCDTVPDDGLPCVQGAGVPCLTACGSAGTGACTAECAIPSGAACPAPAETCNGFDDDCDTVPDDGFACVRGALVSCTTSCATTGSGPCSDACAAPAGADCLPPAETCNAADDDCDGATDEIFPCIAGRTQTCTAGECSGTRSCSATCVPGPCEFGTPPPDDTCAGPLIDVSAGGTFVGTTCAANNDYTFACGLTTAASPDLVFRLVLPAPRDVVIDTLDSSFDAMLFVRSGTTCPGSVTERCDDNSGGGSPGQARIQWSSAPAGTYWVILDGSGAGSRGTWVLNVSVTVPPPPVNDACAGATLLSTTATGTTQFALDDHSPACASGTGGRDVWYRFTLSSRQIVYLDTVDGNAWNSTLAVLQGTCPAPATDVACSDDACGGPRSQWYGTLDAGTYYVVVDGAAAGQEGAFTLLFQRSACTGATRITADGDHDGTTTGLPGEYSGYCGGSGPDAEYWLVLCGPRTVTATTCNAETGFDSVLYFRSGSCSGTEIGCNNDSTCALGASRAALTSTLGHGLTFLIVDGYGGASGSYRVTISGL